MKLSDDEKAVIALTTRLGDKDRPSMSTGKWHTFARALRDENLRPADIFSRRFPNVSDDETAQLEELLSDAPAALVAADDLSNRGIWLLTIAGEEYPALLRDRLGSQAPPVIFGVGEAGLLHSGGLGIVGSREVDADGARAAEAVAEEAVRLGLHVVSGAARGVDQVAMNAAHQAEGSVVGVISDSLQQRIRSAETMSALDAGRTCLISQQHPAAGFSTGAAMSRNKLIYALSRLTVVIASDLNTGGTWSGAMEALSADYGPVAIWRGKGEGPGNVQLEKQGAHPIAAADELESVLQRTQPGKSPVQMSLIEGQ